MAEGTTFQIDIAAKAAGVDSAAAAVDSLASKLTAAETAATQAAAAVAAGQTSYNQAEAAADRAAKSLEKIGVQAATLQTKMQAAMQAGDAKKFWTLAQAADELAQRQKEAQTVAQTAKTALDNEARSLDALKASAKGAADAQENLGKAHADSQKQLGKAQDAAKKLRDAQGQMGQKAEGALGGLKKLGGPVGGLANTAEDAVEGMGKLSESLGTVGTVAAVSVVAVLAVAAAAATAAYKLGEMTWWAIKLADKEKRLDKIQEKFKKHTTGLFGGLKIDKLLNGFEDLVDLFDETTVTGKAIKVVFDSLIQPLIDGIVAFIPKMRTAFIQFEILVLKALIAIKPYGSEILKVAKVMGVLAAVVVGVLVAALAIGIGIAIVFWTLVIKLGQAMVWVTDTVMGLGKAIYDYFANTSLSQMGIDLITGLANGILGAGPAVLSALGGVVGGAIDSAKKMLGIASPSKVFAEIGANTAEGMAVGVDGGTGDVQGSLESLVAPPAASASASGGGGNSVGGVTIIINGVAGAAEAIGEIEAALTRILEGDVAQLGGAVPG